MLETELPEIALFLQDVKKITAEIETAGWGGKGGEGWGEARQRSGAGGGGGVVKGIS